MFSAENKQKVWENGEDYNQYILEELSSFRKAAWKKQLTGHFGDRKDLKILDAGTGPGFFSCILSEEGYDVTGVDFSAGMLHYARENSRRLGVSPRLLRMNLNQITFPDDSFDVIVTRNVTWTLSWPEKVYAEFRRVLKAGGILLIYDANWHAHWYDREKLQRVRAREEAFLKKYGFRRIVSEGNMEYLETCPLTRKTRPVWDENVLEELGFQVTVQEDIGKTLSEEWEKELYGESPLFEICAVKKEREEAENRMRRYWNYRSETYGFSEEEVDRIAYDFGRFIPGQGRKILDVGCGTGMVSAAMCRLGHQVTATDLTEGMLGQAAKNLSERGLNARFLCTSADNLPFEDNSFDAVVSRLVTWALPDPEEALRQWQRVLKPGGMLIYADGDQYRYLRDRESWEYREKYRELAGWYHQGEPFDPSLCDETAYHLPLTNLKRPFEWDDVVLPRLGFDIVAEEIYYPQKKLKYGTAEGFSTHFVIAAVNGKETAVQNI